MRRLKTSDWSFVGWHYKLIHAAAPAWHNPWLVRANGVENLPKQGGFLYAANHSSWWDPIVLQTSIGRPVNWLAKREMMNNRFNKWFFFDRGGCIPVDRDRKNPRAFRDAVQAVRDDRVLGIFPEGTRNNGDTLLPARPGVARIALEAGVPVVPTALLTDRFWPRGRKIPNLRERVWLNVGAPMKLEGDATNRADARRETDRVMAEIQRLLDEARAARDARAPWASP